MTYRARHARPAPRARARARELTAGSAVTSNGRALSAATGDAATSRYNRIGTPLLLIGAGAFALGLARFVLHAAEPSFLARMFDLGIYRDGGMIVRHAYHFRSGQPTPLYDWVSPGGGNPFTYPPFAAAIFAVMSYLRPLVLQWGMTAASFAALIAAIWLTLAGVGVARGRMRAGSVLAVSAVALWTQPVQSNLGLGQINLLLMAAVIWDLRPRAAGTGGPQDTGTRPLAAAAASTGRWWTGAATGIAAGVKLTPLIFIPYLLVTRRFRQAAVATAAFAATAGIGFAVMPGASATYWQSGLFDRANGTPRANLEFFFASASNQSLRGYLSRLVPHAQLAVTPWLIAAALTAATGLLCATWLHRDGYPMLGLLTCALTGLMISPVSWLHHWVWVGPWLAALTGMALLARGASRRAWLGVAGLIALAFVNWPRLPLLTASPHGLNVIADVPMKQPLAWHGTQLVAGNAYLLAGAAGIAALFGWGIVRAFRPSQVMASRPAASPSSHVATNVEIIPGAMTYRE